MKYLGSVIALVFVAINVSGCHKTVNALLFERHSVTQGSLNGFTTGMTKADASSLIRKYKGVTTVEVLRNGQDCAISGTDIAELRSFKLWQFYDASVHPAGATYCLYFKDDHLVRIEYMRERVQVE